jgi:hypothetical protein
MNNWIRLSKLLALACVSIPLNGMQTPAPSNRQRLGQNQPLFAPQLRLAAPSLENLLGGDDDSDSDHGAPLPLRRLLPPQLTPDPEADAFQTPEIRPIRRFVNPYQENRKPRQGLQGSKQPYGPRNAFEWEAELPSSDQINEFKSGLTRLHRACSVTTPNNVRCEYISRLLKAGANPLMRTAANQLPIDILLDNCDLSNFVEDEGILSVPLAERIADMMITLETAQLLLEYMPVSTRTRNSNYVQFITEIAAFIANNPVNALGADEQVQD